MLSSQTDSIFGHVISARTSRDLWISLESMFTSHSQAKELQIWFLLTNLSKGDQPIFEYFGKVKLLVNILAVTGAPLSEKEYVSYILNGLDPSFESFITSITTRPEPIFSLELFHLVLIHEGRLNHSS